MTPGPAAEHTLGREEDWWQAVPHQDVIGACGPRAGGRTTCSINLGAAWLGSAAAWKSHQGESGDERASGLSSLNAGKDWKEAIR